MNIVAQLVFYLLFPLRVTMECAADIDRNIFLWSVSNPQTGSQGFLFGTIHVPYTDVWDRVSERVHEAFAYSDSVLLEVDLHNPQSIRKLMRCKNLPRKQTARTYLPDDLYDRIDRFMLKLKSKLRAWAEKEYFRREETYRKSKEIYESIAGNWHRKRPEWLLFQLYQLCENFMERSNSPMLDVYLAQKALEDSKSIDAIETVEEQCHPISSLSTDDIVFAINYTMYYLDHLHSDEKLLPHKKQRSLSDLVQHYRCGSLENQLLNTNQLIRTGFDMSHADRERAKKIDAALKDDILVKRNKRMAERLDEIFTEFSDQTIFTAVGTGHFLGNSSILNHLEAMNYLITPIKNEDHLIHPSAQRKNLHFNALWTRDHPIELPEVIIEVISSAISPHTLTICLFNIVYYFLLN